MIASACGPPGVDVRAERPEGFALVTQVADTADNSGDGVSLTTDAAGNPHLAYLSFLPKAIEGEPAPAVDVLGVHVPAVKHAHFVGGSWTRSVVRDTPLEGEEVDNPQPELTPDDDTAIVLDAEGVHHVVFTASGKLFYSNNAEGAFSEPQQVSGGPATAPTIAAAEDGTLWVAFYEDVEGAEGPGSLVRAATLAGKEPAWVVETAAEAAPDDPRGTGIGVHDDQPTIAYGSEGTVFVARRSAAGAWQSEVALTGRSGRGVSLDIDPDGNPHLALYADDEVVHTHSIGGARWEVSTVGEASGPDPESSTSIALDEGGIHHIAWSDPDGVRYANNGEGEFAEEEIPGSAGGVQPAMGAGAEGIAAIGWYQPKEELLKVSIRSEEEPLLAIPGESPIVGPGETPGAECEPDGTELSIVAPPSAFVEGFATDCLAAPAGEAFTIDFDNQDEGQMHNVAIYSADPIGDPAAQEFFSGEIFIGPDVRLYEPDPIEEGGTYFFRCDVHGSTMTGAFVVA